MLLLRCSNPKSWTYAQDTLGRLAIEVTISHQYIQLLVDAIANAGAVLAKERAASALTGLARDSDENRDWIVGKGGVAPLLELLETNSLRVKENALTALVQLCRKSPGTQAAVTEAGAIPKILGVFGGLAGVASAKEVLASMCELYSLAACVVSELVKDNSPNKEAFAEGGAVQYLVMMLGSQKMQANAARALAALAREHTENRSLVARLGAIGPLCALLREGDDGTKVQSAAALWAIASGDTANKQTIAKLGCVDPLVALLVTGSGEKSLIVSAGALTSLASRHVENRGVVAKRLVGLLKTSAMQVSDRAVRVLAGLARFTHASTHNQIAIAKSGGVAPLVKWLTTANDQQAQTEAASVLRSLSTNNPTTQALIIKSSGLPPLVSLLRTGGPEGQDNAARALWHLAGTAEAQEVIIEAGAIEPLVGMLRSEREHARGLSAITILQLVRHNAKASAAFGRAGVFPPLVSLLAEENAQTQQQGAEAVAELALAGANRDTVAAAGGVPPLIELLSSRTPGTPSIASRALAQLAQDVEMPEAEAKPEPEGGAAAGDGAAANGGEAGASAENAAEGTAEGGEEGASAPASVAALGGAERRQLIASHGGIAKLVDMLALAEKGTTEGGSFRSRAPGSPSKAPPSPMPSETPAERARRNSTGRGFSPASVALTPKSGRFTERLGGHTERHDTHRAAHSGAAEEDEPSTGAVSSQDVQEQAAAALSALALHDEAMQDAIVRGGGVAPLLSLVREGTDLAQEHGARAICRLAAASHNQRALIEAGACPELISLMRVGSPKAQECAVAGLLDLVRGFGGGETGGGEAGHEPAAEGEEGQEGGAQLLVQIVEAGGIVPLVGLLSSGSPQGKEKAVAALCQLAVEPSNRDAIVTHGGIPAIVSLLDDRSLAKHGHATKALLSLSQEWDGTFEPTRLLAIAKWLTSMLSSAKSPEGRRRTARVMRELASTNPGSDKLIVSNAGAVAPLMKLLSAGNADVMPDVVETLLQLARGNHENQCAIGAGLVKAFCSGSDEVQAATVGLMLSLANLDMDARRALVRVGAAPPLAAHLASCKSHRSIELRVALLADLCTEGDLGITAVVGAGAIKPLVSLVESDGAEIQANAVAALRHIARSEKPNKKSIVSEGGVERLVRVLREGRTAGARADAAGALWALCDEYPKLQAAVVVARAIEPLVAALEASDGRIQAQSAGALASLVAGVASHQDAVAEAGGLPHLVAILTSERHDEVHAQAARAIHELARGPHAANQEALAGGGCIAPLLALLRPRPPPGEAEAEGGEVAGASRDEAVTEAALLALGSLSDSHPSNQEAVAQGCPGGLGSLVKLLEAGPDPLAAAAVGAIASLCRGHEANASAAAAALSESFSSGRDGSAARAAAAARSLAERGACNEAAMASSGLLAKLVEHLGRPAPTTRPTTPAPATMRGGARSPEPVLSDGLREALQAVRALCAVPGNHPVVVEAGGIRHLTQQLGHFNSSAAADAAATLETLALATADNLESIAGAIVPLVALLQRLPRNPEAQHFSAAVLDALGEDERNHKAMGEAGVLPSLLKLLEVGGARSRSSSPGPAASRPGSRSSSPALGAAQPAAAAAAASLEAAAGAAESHEVLARDRASSALRKLVNRRKLPVADLPLEAMVRSLAGGGAKVRELAAELLDQIASAPGTAAALVAAGAVPALARQLEGGSDEAQAAAVEALSHIGTQHEGGSATRTQILRELLASMGAAPEDERRRIGSILRKWPPPHSSIGEPSTAVHSAIGPMTALLFDDGYDSQLHARWFLKTEEPEKVAELSALDISKPLVRALAADRLCAAAKERAQAILKLLGVGLPAVTTDTATGAAAAASAAPKPSLFKPKAALTAKNKGAKGAARPEIRLPLSGGQHQAHGTAESSRAGRGPRPSSRGGSGPAPSNRSSRPADSSRASRPADSSRSAAAGGAGAGAAPSGAAGRRGSKAMASVAESPRNSSRGGATKPGAPPSHRRAPAAAKAHPLGSSKPHSPGGKLHSPSKSKGPKRVQADTSTGAAPGKELAKEQRSTPGGPVTRPAFVPAISAAAATPVDVSDPPPTPPSGFNARAVPYTGLESDSSSAIE